jgi:hypothetical protein
MASFPIRWMHSNRGYDLAGFESRSMQAHGYAFCRRSQCREYDLYSCLKCRKIYDQNRKDNRKNSAPLPSIRVAGDVFLSDPDQLPHVCMENGPTADTLWSKLLEKGCNSRCFLFFKYLNFGPSLHTRPMDFYASNRFFAKGPPL